MTQVMKAKPGQSCGLQDALELMRDVAVIERRADGAGENVAGLLPAISRPLALRIRRNARPRSEVARTVPQARTLARR